MPLTTILMLLAPDDATLTLSRYDALVRNTLAFKVEVTTSSPQMRTVYHSTFWRGQSGRVRIETVFPSGGFALSLTERGRVDIDRTERIYDEYPTEWPARIQPSRLTDSLSSFFPGFYLSKSSRNWFPARDKLTYSKLGENSVVSSKSDSGEVRAEFLPNGEFLKIRQTQISQMGSVTFDFAVKNWRPVADNLAQFVLPIPNGYTPVSVSDYGYPADVGAKVSLGEWITNGKKTNVDNLAKTSGVLLVFADPKNPSGKLLVQAMAKVKLQSVPVLKLGDENSEPGWSQNPDGKFLRSINPPGSPYVVLVGKDGRVKYQWFGISADLATKFVTEVDAAVESMLNPAPVPPKRGNGPVSSGGTATPPPVSRP